MTLESGTRLGPYEILSPLGAGGMGEVYRAMDTKLDRQVAIKVLPETMTRDKERVARFEREAKLLASLSHPSIAAIHGFDDLDGTRFLVLEYVEGKTLGDLLKSGPVAVEDALDIAKQIAEALEAAHGQGVIHRDLKPANVMIREDRTVKVLDFGLAKAMAEESTANTDANSPTITANYTRPGVVLGTAAYMSPEQARGRSLDKRTDIWSFGCVLYELLTSKRTFDGQTTSDVLAKILERDPEMSALPPNTPPKIIDLVRRCLEKTTGRRLRDIGDAVLELDEAISTRAWSVKAVPAATGIPAQKKRRGRQLITGGLLITVGMVIGVGVWKSVRPPQIPQSTAALTHVARLTHDPGFTGWPTWSPDSNQLAFSSNRSGNSEIYVRRVDGGQDINVTNDPADDIQPAFSPDGNRIAFVSTRSSRTALIRILGGNGFEFRTFGGDIWIAPALGGQPRRLAQNGNFPVWHPDGRRIAYVSGSEDHRSILQIPAEGGSPRAVLPSGESTWEIVRLQYTPSGNWISFETSDQRVFVLPTVGGTPRKLLRGSSHAWDPSGERLYFLIRDPQGGTRLQVVNIDPGSQETLGDPQTFGLMTGILRDLAIARDGEQLVVSLLEESLNLTLLPLTERGNASSGPEDRLSIGQVIDRYPSFSPDGKRIAFSSNRLGPQEIWIVDLDTKKLERLRLPGEDLGAAFPYWARDGQQLAVTRFLPDGTAAIWLVSVDGSLADELVPPKPGLLGSPFSPDGRSLLYSYRVDGFLQLFVLELGSREERQLTFSPSDHYNGDWSPDGRWIILCSNASGVIQVSRIPASGGESNALTSGYERMRHMFYSPDGEWVYVQPSHRNIYRLPASGGPLEQVTNFPKSGLFIEEPTLSPNGRHLAYCRSNGGSSLWVLTIGNTRSEAP